MEMPLSCDRLDANTSDEGKSHRQIPFEGGIALAVARTKGPPPELKQWLTELLKENVEQLSMREWPSLEDNLKSTGRQSSSSCSKKAKIASDDRTFCNSAVRMRPRGTADTTWLTSVETSHVRDRSHGWNHAQDGAPHSETE